MLPNVPSPFPELFKCLLFVRLTNLSSVSGGALSKVHHFDSKADVEEYIRKIGVPATFFMPGFYMSNIPGKSFAPNPDNGTYRFALPIPANSPIPLFDTGSDTGKFVKAILLNREKCLGKNVLGATDYYTPDQIVEQFKEVKPKAGHGATYAELPPEAFKGFLAKTGMPEPVQEEMLQNMQLMPQFGYYGGASLKESQDVSFTPLFVLIVSCTLHRPISFQDAPCSAEADNASCSSWEVV